MPVVDGAGRGVDPPAVEPFQLPPEPVGPGRQVDVAPVDVGVPEDPAATVRSATPVTGSELLEEHHAVAAQGQLPRRGGAMGSAAAWQLALRGHRVVLFEQFGPGHRRGASHGSSRIFRHAYVHRRYINLATRADRLWRQLERLDGGRVYTRTGAVDHGHPAEVFALSRALTEAGVDNSLLRPTEAALRWPGIRFDTMVLHHPAAGRIDADRAVAALQRQAAAAGANIWHHTTATGLRLVPSGVRVVTDSGHLRFDQAVVAAGAWTSKVLQTLPGLRNELPALRTTQEQPAHFAPAGEPVDWPSFIHHPGADLATAPGVGAISGGFYGP